MPEFEKWIAGLAVDGLEHLVDSALSHSPVLTAMLQDLHARVSALEAAARPVQPEPEQESGQPEQPAV